MLSEKIVLKEEKRRNFKYKSVDKYRKPFIIKEGGAEYVDTL